ncbi:N-acetyl-beta-D-galactosaminidase [Aureococcus anophagefferens]|nr:N-acetyl-beta-D-galactosaminidase [Aureococcus anophagefferens]
MLELRTRRGDVLGVLEGRRAGAAAAAATRPEYKASPPALLRLVHYRERHWARDDECLDFHDGEPGDGGATIAVPGPHDAFGAATPPGDERARDAARCAALDGGGDDAAVARDRSSSPRATSAAASAGELDATVRAQRQDRVVQVAGEEEDRARRGPQQRVVAGASCGRPAAARGASSSSVRGVRPDSSAWGVGFSSSAPDASARQASASAGGGGTAA